MVDMETYKHMHPQERDKESIPDRLVVDVLDPDVVRRDNPTLDPAFYLCLPATTIGFNMQKKEWGTSAPPLDLCPV